MELPKRKNIRLKGYDYNTPGWYFITICTKNKEKLLCNIVGTDVLGGPQTQLAEYGAVAEKYLRTMSEFYRDVKLESYVIMPNHIHLLLYGIKKQPPVDMYPENWTQENMN